MLKDNRPRPNAAPKHLAPPEAQLWDRLMRSFTLDDPASQELLLQACETRGRARQAREQIAEEGATYRDDRGNLKAHPAITTERAAQASFLSAVRLLRLELTGEPK
jgi:P27 family predicted phage terminase small subunit